MTVTVELFYSPTCLYCPRARKTLLEAAEELGENVRVREINVLSQAGVEEAEKYGVRGVPTMVVNGKAQITGVPTREQLLRAIQGEMRSNENRASSKPRT
mgnify:FL=1